ncbi:hypothetical protein MTO96_027492 [Rhipicephalus appendiculatus]
MQQTEGVTRSLGSFTLGLVYKNGEHQDIVTATVLLNQTAQHCFGNARWDATCVGQRISNIGGVWTNDRAATWKVLA